MKAIVIHGYGGPEVLKYEVKPMQVTPEPAVLFAMAEAMQKKSVLDRFGSEVFFEGCRQGTRSGREGRRGKNSFTGVTGWQRASPKHDGFPQLVRDSGNH